MINVLKLPKTFQIEINESFNFFSVLLLRKRPQGYILPRVNWKVWKNDWTAEQFHSVTF